LTLLAGTGNGIAKPKTVLNGCTMGQIQTPEMGQCINKAEDDLLHNHPTTHVPYCSSDGRMLCCELDGNGNIVDHSCEVLSHISLHRPDITVGPGLTVKGGEGTPANPGVDTGTHGGTSGTVKGGDGGTGGSGGLKLPGNTFSNGTPLTKAPPQSGPVIQ
jgi:hypothetical protein